MCFQDKHPVSSNTAHYPESPQGLKPESIMPFGGPTEVGAFPKSTHNLQ